MSKEKGLYAMEMDCVGLTMEGSLGEIKADVHTIAHLLRTHEIILDSSTMRECWEMLRDATDEGENAWKLKSDARETGEVLLVMVGILQAYILWKN